MGNEPVGTNKNRKKNNGNMKQKGRKRHKMENEKNWREKYQKMQGENPKRSGKYKMAGKKQQKVRDKYKKCVKILEGKCKNGGKIQKGKETVQKLREICKNCGKIQKWREKTKMAGKYKIAEKWRENGGAPATSLSS
jgi:hypothetical protein